MAVDRIDSLAPRRPRFLKAVGIILGIGLATSTVAAIPAFADGGHTLDDIKHGYALQTGAAASAFLMILVFGLVAMQRRADADRSPWPVYWGILATFFAAGMTAILLPALSAHKLAVDLDARGVPAQAHVVRQFTEGCGKSGCVIKLEYAFPAGKEGHNYRGFSSEGNANRYPSEEYKYAVSTGTIPILYDPTDPNRSEVYWSDYIHRQAGQGIVSTVVKVLTGFLVFGIMMIAGFLYFGARAASATRSSRKHAAD